MKIDSHQHFWLYDPAEHVWMTNEMAALKRNFLPGNLEPILSRAGYDGTVAVQARQSTAETEWLLELAGRHGFIKGVVGWVDLRSPEVGGNLEKYARNPLLKGVRHVVHDEPDDRFMLEEFFLKGLGRLAAFDLTYDLLLFPHHLPVAVEAAEKFPAQRFVIDHIAKPDLKRTDLAAWARGMKKIAAFPNVWCKLSGMVTEARWGAWQHEDFVPALDIVFDCFGPDRLMIGSDWPVCTLSGSYRDVMRIVERYLSGRPSEDREKVLGCNAAAFYGLESE